MFGKGKEKEVINRLLTKVALLELKALFTDSLVKNYRDKIEDLQSVVNIQRSTIEGLKTGRYSMN
jgi:hypothetical protein